MSSESPSLIKRLQQEVDELIVQLDLGKTEALDYVEKRKADLRQVAGQAKEKIGAGEATSALHQKLDELRLQLALGRMESRDSLEEQREKIHSAIDGAKHAFEPVEHELKSVFDTTSESLKARLDLLALDLGLGKIVAEEELKTRKDQVKEQLRDIRVKLKSSAGDAGEIVSQTGQEAKAAFDEIRSNLGQLFR